MLIIIRYSVKLLRAGMPSFLFFANVGLVASLYLNLGFSAMTLGVSACLGLNYVVIHHATVKSRLRTRHRKLQRTAHNRLEKIKNTMDIVFQYESNKDVFLRRMAQSVRVETLKEYKVIDFEHLHMSRRKRMLLERLSANDAEFYLLAQHFSNSQLSVAYGYSNTQSIYTRRARVNARIRKIEAELAQQRRCKLPGRLSKLLPRHTFRLPTISRKANKLKRIIEIIIE